MFIIEISYNVLYVWHCMELYDKKFLVYGNCMIRSFGHPGCLYDIAITLSSDFLCVQKTLVKQIRSIHGKFLPIIIHFMHFLKNKS